MRRITATNSLPDANNMPHESPPVKSYEQRLDEDLRWAMMEGSRHFDEASAVFQALKRVTKRLEELGVPYAVVGGMALFRHGLRRFTEDVDILVTKQDLQRIHESMEGRGYRPPHPHSKHLRDTELGVRIEFLTTGEFPGDGKPKPVMFPDPSSVAHVADGIRFVNLPTLVDLKLASGMTNAARRKDLSDVQELIKVLHLPASFAEQLNSYVRPMFRELWREIDESEPSEDSGISRDEHESDE